MCLSLNFIDNGSVRTLPPGGDLCVITMDVYALWQIVRETPPVLAAFYWMQMLLSKQLHFAKRKNKNLIDADNSGHKYVVLRDQESKCCTCPTNTNLTGVITRDGNHLNKYFDDPKKRETGMNGVKLISFDQYWYKVKFEGSYYYCHQNVLFQWAMYDIDKKILLIDSQKFTKDLVIGEKVTSKKFFESLLGMDMHINELYAPCLFGKDSSLKVSLRLSTVLATVPLLLQARNLSVESAVATLAIILVPIYNIYDVVMLFVSKFVKLYIFCQFSSIYTFFGWFSQRWSACDRDKGYAYFTNGVDIYPVATFVKFANEMDVLEFKGISRIGKPCIESYGLQIDGGVIYAAEFGLW